MKKLEQDDRKINTQVEFGRTNAQKWQWLCGEFEPYCQLLTELCDGVMMIQLNVCFAMSSRNPWAICSSTVHTPDHCYWSWKIEGSPTENHEVMQDLNIRTFKKPHKSGQIDAIKAWFQSTQGKRNDHLLYCITDLFFYFNIIFNLPKKIFSYAFRLINMK